MAKGAGVMGAALFLMGGCAGPKPDLATHLPGVWLSENPPYKAGAASGMSSFDEYRDDFSFHSVTHSFGATYDEYAVLTGNWTPVDGGVKVQVWRRRKVVVKGDSNPLDRGVFDKGALLKIERLDVAALQYRHPNDGPFRFMRGAFPPDVDPKVIARITAHSTIPAPTTSSIPGHP